MRRTISMLALTLAAFTAVTAQDSDIRVGLDGVRWLYGYIPTGADATLTYTGLDFGLDGQTKLFLKAGGGYEDKTNLRDLVTGDPAFTDWTYNSPNFQWELAFIQGLMRREDGKNLVETFLFYRGRGDIYDNSSPSAAFADASGLFQTSFMAGASFDSVLANRHRSKSGVYAEAAAEWAPGFLNSVSDFWRASAQASGFLPLLDLPTEGGNLFNAYLAGFLGVDYASGPSVPIYANQSFGGRKLRDSLGDCVRGYEWSSYDSSFKAVANGEIRLVGPALKWDSVVPYLYGFVDGGWYDGFSGAQAQAGLNGFLASAGGGVALDLFGFAQIGLVAGAKLIEDELYGQPDPFFWALKFALHF